MILKHLLHPIPTDHGVYTVEGPLVENEQETTCPGSSPVSPTGGLVIFGRRLCADNHIAPVVRRQSVKWLH